MAVPTFTNSSGVVFTFNDGDSEGVECNIQANPDFDAMGLTPPTEAFLYDVNGAQKIITMRGNLSNSGTNRLSVGVAQTIDGQRKWLEQNINGNQSGLIFTSTYSSSWNGTGWIDSTVIMGNIRFMEREGNPNGLEFEITLLVGTI